MSLVKHFVVICGLLFALPVLAQSSDESLFDTIFDTLLITGTANQLTDDTQAVTSESDSQWARLEGGDPDTSGAVYSLSDLGAPDLSGQRTTPALQTFPSETGTITVRELPVSTNAFDEIFDVLLDTLVTGEEPAAGTNAER